MNASAEKIEYYTIEDLYNLPEETRAELIDGKLYMMSAPDVVHQRISSYLHNEIYNYIKKITKIVNLLLLHLRFSLIRMIKHT